ncbi:MAG: CsgG/HfaB family protein [Treponema sp.]|jgi:hypothetical protein|nr:CsgG/HfaB family protein [Treponema sp.]
MKRKMVMAGFVCMCLAYTAAAQTAADRQIPRSDLTALPGPGQSEVLIKSIRNGKVNGWFNVYLDGVLVAQLEPGIPEKIIVPNGFAKLLFKPVYYNTRRKEWKEQLSGVELVCEAASNSITVEVVYTFGIIKMLMEANIVETKPLPQAAGKPSLAPRVPPPPENTGDEGTIETALYRAGETLINNLPEDTTIAILSVSSQEREMSEFVIDELAYVLVNAGNYKIVDRRSLEAIREERDFQLSAEVDDESAVSIGKLLGANVVITGSISGSDSMRRLRLKALDVQTAQIVAMASEKF